MHVFTRLFSPALFFILGLCGGFLPLGSKGAEPAAPTRLMIDLLEHPEQGEVAVPHPTFTWILPPECEKISAYQIQLGSNPTALESGPMKWDSGRVVSGDSVSVPYSGPPLEAKSSYAWKVRIWEGGETPGPWSSIQEFRTASTLRDTAISRYRLQALPQSPVEVKNQSAGGILVDFGQAAFGSLRLEIESDRAFTLTVRLGEKLKNDGIEMKPGGHIRAAEVKVAIEPGQRTYPIALKPDKRNTGPEAIPIPEEFGVILPFRWVELMDCPVPADKIRPQRIAVQYPFDSAASSFRCSDDTLNTVWDLCKHTIAATTFAGLYVDGDRERIPYEADAYLNQLSHYATDREFTLARATHEYLLRKPTWPTEWKQHSVLIAWEDYLHTGDRRMLETAYETLKKEKIFLERQRADGLLETAGLRDIVDWPVSERDGYELLPVNTVVNAFFFHTLVLMERIARVLGKEEDAADFSARASRARTAINEKLFDEARGVYVDGEGSTHAAQHANFFPLAFGVVPTERVDRVIQFLRDRGMACSVYGAQYLLEALYQHGAAEAALKLMTAKDERGWWNMREAGSTMTWEAWNAKAKPNLDWNHAWGAAPANILPRYVVGVRPLAPGFSQVLIEPHCGNLEWVEALVPTIRGPVRFRYDRNSDNRRYRLQLPGNTSARVSLPAENSSEVLKEGKPVPAIRQGSRWILEKVPSGEHLFEVR
jgi:alpha-L-rhamnosidase